MSILTIVSIVKLCVEHHVRKIYTCSYSLNSIDSWLVVQAQNSMKLFWNVCLCREQIDHRFHYHVLFVIWKKLVRQIDRFMFISIMICFDFKVDKIKQLLSSVQLPMMLDFMKYQNSLFVLYILLIKHEQEFLLLAEKFWHSINWHFVHQKAKVQFYYKVHEKLVKLTDTLVIWLRFFFDFINYKISFL